MQNKDGKWVAALGYLDKVNDIIEKSRNGTLTQAEFLLFKDLDLAELRSYEQAKDLTIQLLKKWLVKYKFKNWNEHQTTPALKGQPVKEEEKVKRAEEIANKLNSHAEWKSHGRPINIETLTAMGLKIDDYSNISSLQSMIRDYYDLLSDFIQTNKFPIFVHTRNYF